MPSRRRLLTWSTSTMPLFTTTPTRIMIPIVAMKVKVVPDTRKNQNTPITEKPMEVMIESG